MKYPYRFLIFFSLFVLLPATGSFAEPAGELAFVYFESCPSCEEYREAEKIAGMLADLTLPAGSYNLAIPSGESGFKAFLDRQGLEQEYLTLPLLFEGRETIVGYEEILRRVEELLSRL